MIRLRPYIKEDSEYVEKWVTDELVFYQWSADRICKYPMSGKELDKYYNNIIKRESCFPMTAIDENNIPVGHMMMRAIDGNYDTIRFGFIIVDGSLRGKGYGREMLRLAFIYAFNVLNCNKITLGVFENNPGALKAYIKAGLKVDKEKEMVIYNINNEKWPCIEMVKYK